MNDESEVSDIGLWFTLLLLFKFFICTHKYFYYKIKYFAVNKINCRLKYVILLICSILVFL